jgi:hypothetical protein
MVRFRHEEIIIWQRVHSGTIQVRFDNDEETSVSPQRAHGVTTRGSDQTTAHNISRPTRRAHKLFSSVMADYGNGKISLTIESQHICLTLPFQRQHGQATNQSERCGNVFDSFIRSTSVRDTAKCNSFDIGSTSDSQYLSSNVESLNRYIDLLYTYTATKSSL